MATPFPPCSECGDPSDIEHHESTWDDDLGGYVACTVQYLCIVCAQRHITSHGFPPYPHDVVVEIYRLRFNPDSRSYQPQLLN